MCSYSTIDLKDLLVENDLSTIKKKIMFIFIVDMNMGGHITSRM
jgi:hypothetical protein